MLNKYGLSVLFFFFNLQNSFFIFISCVVEWRTAVLCRIGQADTLFISFRLPAAFLTQRTGLAFFASD